ncbi:MAG: hypothetical protein IBX55_21005 [Methyloprofundus sp.]|nr:hypothetical protein [Methyloprofundus sp.]
MTVKIKKIVLTIIVLTPFFFAASYVLLNAYVLSDQVYYHNFYEALKSASPNEVMYLAKQYVSSVEPLSSYLLWVGAKLGFEKNNYISFYNVIILIGVVLFCHKYKVSVFMSFLLITNFYLLVLLTGAERLKFAYLFLIYSTIFTSNLRYIFIGLAPFAHLQSLILLLGVVFGKLSEFIGGMDILKSKISYRIIHLIFFGFIFFATVLVYLYEGLTTKAAIYMKYSGGVYDIYQVLLLTIIALMVSRNKLRMLFIMLSMIVAVILLGGDRINMVAVTLVVYYLTIEGRIDSYPMYFLMGYLSLKSVPFVNNIFIHGTGFI